MDNLEQLQKLAKIFNADKLVTTEDIATVLKGIVEIMNSFKKDNQSLNTETKKIVADSVLLLEAKYNELMNSVDTILTDKRTKIQNEVIDTKKEFQSDVLEIRSLLKEIKSIKSTPGKDGKDGKNGTDAEAIDINDLIKKVILKFPKYKETILDDGKQIVEKINLLQINEENQIDASHIKNLPTGRSGNGGRGKGYHDEIVIPFIISGGGSAIQTGIAGDIEIPFGYIIKRVRLLADQTGSIVIDIWEDTYENYPPLVGDSITASSKPTISAGIKSEDNLLTGWRVRRKGGGILRFNVDSVTDIQRVLVSLTIIKI